MASEYDPRPAGTVALIIGTVMIIGKHECATFEETYNIHRRLRKYTEQYDNISAPNKFDEGLKLWVYWQSTDKRTKARAEIRAGCKRRAGQWQAFRHS